MARKSRQEILELGDGWYHLRGRAACHHGEYPLKKREAWKKLLGLMQMYTSAYCCEVAAFSIMGNHYHMLVRFEDQRPMKDKEVIRRAKSLYPWRPPKWFDRMPQKKRDRLRERLFDVSEYMRNINGRFAEWYNKRYSRRGHFWGERFKSSNVLGGQYRRNCVLYIELNGVRAGLVDRPEKHKACSAYLRDIGKDAWLMPLAELFPPIGSLSAVQHYRQDLYLTGTLRRKLNAASIAPEILAMERARDFRRSGIFLKRCGYFTDGLVLGAEKQVREALKCLQSKGRYRRRKRIYEHHPDHYTVKLC